MSQMKSFLIDLNNVSEEFLSKILKNESLIEEGEVLTKTEKIKRIETELKANIEENEEYVEHLYAGRGSLEIFNIKECPEDSNYHQFVHDLLEKKMGIRAYKKAVNDALYPDAKKEPMINKIRTLKDGKILVQFSLVDRENTIYTGYELQKFPVIKSINCMIHPHKRKLQIRTDEQTSKKCFAFFQDLFKDCILSKVSFNTEQINTLREQLDWKTIEYKGRNMDPDSIISYKTLRKNTRNPDELKESQEFKDETNNYEMVSVLYEIMYNDEKYIVQFGFKRSSIYFRTFATEKVIDFIANLL